MGWDPCPNPHVWKWATAYLVLLGDCCILWPKPLSVLHWCMKGLLDRALNEWLETSIKVKFLHPVISTCLCPVCPGCDSCVGTAEMAGCRQACVCSEPAEPSLISPRCLGEASLHATVHPNINEWKQGIASVLEGRDGGKSQLFLFLPLCLSLCTTPPPAFFFIYY